MSDLSRRSFLKLGASASALTLIGGSDEASAMGAGPERTNIVVDRQVDSCCQYCQVRCTIKVQMAGDRAVGVEANPGNYWTGGTMCPKGKSLAEIHYSPERVIYPMKREGSGFVKITYQEALETMAKAIEESKVKREKDYNNAFLMFAPLWNSHESEIAGMITMDLLGFPNVMPPGDCCISTASIALTNFLGYSGSTCTIDEVLNTKTLILWGANLAETYPPYSYWLNKAKDAGVNIIFIDPRRTPTSNLANWHVQAKPGTDGALLLGIIRNLLDTGRYDSSYVAANVKNIEVVDTASKGYSFERVSEITGLSVEEITKLTDTIAQSPRTIIYMGASLCRYTNGLATVRSVIALQAITNKLLGMGNGLMTMQGGKPAGGEEFISQFHGPEMPNQLNFRRALAAMNQGKVDVMLLSASYRRYPDCNAVAEAIKKVPLVVYRGHFMTPEAELAHIIIPAALPFESEGSQYGAQRQVTWRAKIMDAPGECIDDVQFYIDLGRRLLGDQYPDFKDAPDIYNRLVATVPSWRGITLDRVKKSPSGVVWPLYSENDTEVLGSLFADGKFMTADGTLDLASSVFGPIKWQEPKDNPLEGEGNKEYPLTFIQGKVAHHWQHTFTNYSASNGQFSHGRYVNAHSKTAEKLGLKDGELVFIESPTGKLSAKLEIFDGILEDVIFTPSHFSPNTDIEGNKGEAVNQMVPNNWDRISAQLNGFACRLVKQVA